MNQDNQARIVPTEPPTEPLEASLDRIPDRITRVLNVHHEHHGEQPVGVQAIHSWFLESEHEPYQRRVRVGTEWTKLDTGWLEGVAGSFVLLNTAGGDRLQLPTEGEAAETAALIIQVGFGPDPKYWFEAIPGGYFEGATTPKQMDDIYVRCPSGECPGRVIVFPR